MTDQPIESKVLGKRVEYPQSYCPEILVAVPRHLNRQQYQISDNALPFVGIDVWHAYELSFLTQSGMPVQGVVKISYPANSPCIVESKSLKLYLNSFNMERLGASAADGLRKAQQTIERDLSATTGASVQARIFRHAPVTALFDFADYSILEDNAWSDTLDITQYTEAPQLLRSSGNKGTMRIGTHLLRSNCKITHQPDWGSAYIYIKGNNLPTEQSLLQYLVSIRNENHFHEEICEMIFIRLMRTFAPTELMVSCIYTRRGGIDICPSRATHSHLLPQHLTDTENLSYKLLRQ